MDDIDVHDASQHGYTDSNKGCKGIAVGEMNCLVVRGDEELEMAWELRDARYYPRFSSAMPWWRDKHRDEAGLVFLGVRRGLAVATVRITDVNACSSELEELRRLSTHLKDDRTWELGRLAAIASSRESAATNALHLFALATNWTLANRDCRLVVSHCRRNRLPLFEAAGAVTVDGPYPVPDRGDDYFTVVAKLTDVAERLAAVNVPVRTTIERTG